MKQTCRGRNPRKMKSPSVPSRRKGRFASSTARHRHRISVKSKGADLVARKLATKFGEEAEATAATATVVVLMSMPVPVPNGWGEAARHKGNRFCVNRDPRAPTGEPAFSFFLTSSLAPHATALAILSSRICDHQHAKWIKFLDYTFRRPFFTRFRFLYPASCPASPHSPSRFATVFQIVSPHLRISVPRAVSSTRVLPSPFPHPLSPLILLVPFSALRSAPLPFAFLPPVLPPLSSPMGDLFKSGGGVLQRTDAPLQLFGIYRSSARF